MGDYSFKKDLEVAQKTELEVARYLRDKYNFVFLGSNNTYHYDFEMLDTFRKIRKYEIKEDFLSDKTGSIAIEFSYKGTPAWLNNTEADVVIFKTTVNNEIVFMGIYLLYLKSIIENNNYEIVRGGENENSELYLIPLPEFYKHFTRI